MVYCAIYIYHFGDFDFSIINNRLFMDCIHSHNYPLTYSSEKRCACIVKTEIADWTYNHGPYCIFLKTYARNTNSQVGGQKDASIIDNSDEKGRNYVEQFQSLLMLLVSSFRPHWLWLFLYLLSYLKYWFIRYIFYIYHSNILGPINIYKTRNIASLVRNKFPKNQFAV